MWGAVGLARFPSVLGATVARAPSSGCLVDPHMPQGSHLFTHDYALAPPYPPSSSKNNRKASEQ